MADIPASESQLNGSGGGGGGPIAVTSSDTVGSKRQRRPSVRLGEIGGDQVYDAHHQRRTTAITNNNSTSSNNSNLQWKQHHQLLSIDHKKDSYNKGSKTRALTNLSSTNSEFVETLDGGGDKEVNLDTVAIGSWKVNNKDFKKRASSNATTKRVRSNWVSNVDGNGDGGGGGSIANNNNINNVDGEGTKYSGGEDDADDDDDGYREFDMENSQSPLKEQSPVHSLENLGDGNERNQRNLYYNNNIRTVRARDNHNHHHDGVGADLSGPSDTDARDYRNNGRCGGGGSGREDGVRIWLNSIGLGRYAPIFEIHEVDDEILPMLTLEDLKDMGINAVGSRRKMFCAIQKLGKGFS